MILNHIGYNLLFLYCKMLVAGWVLVMVKVRSISKVRVTSEVMVVVGII